jgi:hypothetical protein
MDDWTGFEGCFETINFVYEHGLVKMLKTY